MNKHLIPCSQESMYSAIKPYFTKHCLPGYGEQCEANASCHRCEPWQSNSRRFAKFLRIVPYVCVAHLQQPGIMMQFWIFVSGSSIRMPKALFCGNINAVLQIVFGGKAR